VGASSKVGIDATWYRSPCWRSQSQELERISPKRCCPPFQIGDELEASGHHNRCQGILLQPPTINVRRRGMKRCEGSTYRCKSQYIISSLWLATLPLGEPDDSSSESMIRLAELDDKVKGKAIVRATIEGEEDMRW
jgi:hypothetical protein